MTTPPAMAAPHTPPVSAVMDDERLTAVKAAARHVAIARRTGRDPAIGDRLATHLLRAGIVPAGVPVAGFWPIQDEIDIRPVLSALHERGHPLALPVTGRRGEPLIFRAWQPGAPLLPGRFGTSHPDGPILTPGAFLIPLLAFDSAGHRLGYGGGFYDRTLALLKVPAIGIAYGGQEVTSLPREPHDMALNMIVTEKGVRRFR
jgi:5-formyltetrahydrofolate cyclo-ligase